MKDVIQPSGQDESNTSQEQALQQLASELRRPPQSLSAFSHLSTEQLTWLSTQVAKVCMHEDEKLNKALHQAIPWLLRPFLLRRLVKSSASRRSS